MTLRFTRLVLGLEILLIQLLGVALFLLYAPSIGYAFDKALVGAVTIAPITGAHVALFVKYISLRVTPEDEAENQQIRAGNFYVKLIIISEEEKGSIDPLEESITAIEGVQSAEVVDVRRAIG